MTEGTVPAGYTVSVSDFARLFDAPVTEIPAHGRRRIAEQGFCYRRIEGLERDRLILGILERIESGTLSQAGPQSRKRWETGWGENLDELSKDPMNLDRLTPKYIRAGQPLRLDGGYIMPERASFELEWYSVFREWLFRRYLGDGDVVYEFGCGSGHNLAALAQLFPDRRCVGLDWATASCEIIDRLAATHGWNLEGRVFDFFQPDLTLKLEPNCAVLTVGALEQTGTRYGPFLDFLLDAAPAICVHSEPVCEWYDAHDLADYLAILFHRRRGYWEGFPARLKQLEAEGRVEIVKMTRSRFGSLYLDGYSQIVWRPRRRR